MSNINRTTLALKMAMIWFVGIRQPDTKWMSLSVHNKETDSKNKYIVVIYLDCNQYITETKSSSFCSMSNEEE